MKPQSEDFSPTTESTQIVYKTIDNINLKLHVFIPEGHKKEDKRACIIFFFGGGWTNGSPKQFYPQCEYLKSRKMVAISAEYRIKSLHNTTPFESLKDAKSAIRWLRNNSEELGIDPEKVAAGGGSAGAHLATAAGTATTIEETEEKDTVSCTPNALVLFNPVYDNGPESFGHDTIKNNWKNFSPMHNITSASPPSIVFLGTEDNLIPVATAEKFKNKMHEAGVSSTLFLYEGQPHGFFNYREGDNIYYYKTLVETDKFLEKLGFITGPPTLKAPEKQENDKSFER
jgi:acetyl esterase/lipase